VATIVIISSIIKRLLWWACHLAEGGGIPPWPPTGAGAVQKLCQKHLDRHMEVDVCSPAMWVVVQCTGDEVNQLRPVPCPHPAVYHTEPSDGCLHRLTVGCHQQSTINIDHSCTRHCTPLHVQYSASSPSSLNQIPQKLACQ